MAKKQGKTTHYHVGENGKISECRATKRGCPYAKYDSYSAAVAAKQLIVSNSAEGNEYNEKAQKIREHRQEYVAHLSIDMDNPYGYARTLVKRMDYLESQGQPRYEFVNLNMNSTIGDTNFKLRRSVEPHDNTRKIYSVYEITTEDSRGIVTSSEKMYLDSPSDARNLKTKLFTTISKATKEAYPNDPETAERERDRYLDTAMNAVKTAETETHGVIEADKWGMSFFNGSTADEMIVKANISQTTFRGDMIRDALNGDAYTYSNPKVNITIQDSRPTQTNAYWTAIYQNNSWFVQTIDNDGNGMNYGPWDDPKEISNAVGYFSREEMGLDDNEMCSSMDTMTEIVESTKRYREQHAIDVEKNILNKTYQQSAQEREEAQRIAAEHAASSQNNDSVFGKFMNLFQ